MTGYSYMQYPIMANIIRPSSNDLRVHTSRPKVGRKHTMHTTTTGETLEKGPKDADESKEGE